MTPDQRRAALAERLQTFTSDGWRVESQTDFNAVLAKGNKHHILHLILSILTAGLWLIVWGILAFTSKEHRRVLMVDENGQVSG